MGAFCDTTIDSVGCRYAPRLHNTHPPMDHTTPHHFTPKQERGRLFDQEVAHVFLHLVSEAGYVTVGWWWCVVRGVKGVLRRGFCGGGGGFPNLSTPPQPPQQTHTFIHTYAQIRSTRSARRRRSARGPRRSTRWRCSKRYTTQSLMMFYNQNRCDSDFF